jgi:hypothetical protein
MYFLWCRSKICKLFLDKLGGFKGVRNTHLSVCRTQDWRLGTTATAESGSTHVTWRLCGVYRTATVSGVPSDDITSYSNSPSLQSIPFQCFLPLESFPFTVASCPPSHPFKISKPRPATPPHPTLQTVTSYFPSGVRLKKFPSAISLHGRKTGREEIARKI